jgi:hypothetical protein
MKAFILIPKVYENVMLVPNILTVGTKVADFIYFYDYLLHLYTSETKLEW